MVRDIIEICKGQKMKVPKFFGLSGYVSKELESRCEKAGMIKLL